MIEKCDLPSQTLSCDLLPDYSIRLTLRSVKGFEDWFVIEKQERPETHLEWEERVNQHGTLHMHSARLSDGDCEGTRSEMLEIADAISHRHSIDPGDRCGVLFHNFMAYFYSPRNTNMSRAGHYFLNLPEGVTPVSLLAADDLAKLIVSSLG